MKGYSILVALLVLAGTSVQAKPHQHRKQSTRKVKCEQQCEQKQERKQVQERKGERKGSCKGKHSRGRKHQK